MRILLADDAAKVRFALRVLLERRRDFRVVGEAVDTGELLALSKAIVPDLILLDWELPGYGPELTLLALKVHCPHTRVVALSSNPESEKEAKKAGADAFISKTAPPGYVLKVLYGVRNEFSPSPLAMAKEA
jgi:DNA-binding NarL/FixJ family response regulator